MKKNLLLIVILSAFSTQAQIGLDSLSGARNPITVAVPFLTFAPDSRASAMGDVGVATSADVYSVNWNNAKLAMVENKYGVSFSYSPWLRNIVNDMSLNYLAAFMKIDDAQAVGVNFRYFDLGEVKLIDEGREFIRVDNPNELAVDGTYSRKLSEYMSIGATFRFIWSNIASNLTGAPDAQAGTSLAVDLGWYYKKPMLVSGMESDLSFGAHLSNLGGKLTYSTDSRKSFIPGNLRLGTAYKLSLNPTNTLTFALDFNKLLVPTPPIYKKDKNGNYEEDNDGNKIIAKGKDPNRSFFAGTFGSFSDAPGGFSEEMKEFTISTGLEYWYKDFFSARTGYFYENEAKGGRKYMTIGTGIRYQVFGFDFSYLVPFGQNHPLADTFRVSVMFNFE